MAASSSPAGRLRSVWRWHLLAGLGVAPFAIFLALTGAAFLWKPQYEAWRYRDLLETTGPASATMTADQWLVAAQQAMPGAVAQQVIPPPRPGRSAEIVFGSKKSGGQVSVFVDPNTGAVLGKRAESDRLMTLIHDLHGTLLLGATGEVAVELAASWAFILVVTGLYLWWPRPFRVGGFLVPRLRGGRRLLFRDLHAVPAVWFSLATLLLLATGMPWTRVSGAWIRTVAKWTGEWQPRETQASAHRSEVLGGWSPYLGERSLAEKVEQVASAPPPGKPTPLTLEQVRGLAKTQGVTDAYAIALPQGPEGVYSILSDRNRAFTRTYLHLDQYSGRVLADVRYKDFGRIAKFFTFGIILHEGQLFGLANQVGGTVAAFGVILMAASGVWLWWSRRPAGAKLLPAPGDGLPPFMKLAFAFCALIAPLFAASLVLLGLGFLFSRIISPTKTP